MSTPSQPINGLSYEDVQRIVAEQLATRDAVHKEEIDALRAQLDAAIASMAVRGVVTLIPLHAAGHGTEIAETWSQYEQEIARTGLGVSLVDYVKKLEGIDGGGNILVRFQNVEKSLNEVKEVLDKVAAAAHSH